MRVVNKRAGQLAVLAMLSIPVSGNLYAQQPSYDPIVVEGALPDLSTMAKGPEVKGTIIARNGEKLRVRTADGSSTDIAITDATKVKTSSGLFGGRSKMGNEALLNGLPVTVKTLQWDGGLVASQVSFRKGDFKPANMIRNGTEQQFAEQTAATEALRGRMGDIDKYNVKGVTNVYFDTGKAALSSNAKQDLCAAASQAESTDNALLLVVGYTDSVGSEEYNQTLSEKRASSVINYLQQHCRWKPYRMLTPTGMSEADPAADNETPEGKAQNRRVAVNILVSKSVDGF